ncbi:MAG: bifunctional (p)ppGpp synthetase/guanosine-3',5'-bis(diphosphate) 3'-pyrophosphohydrolase [Bacillota bacterium]|jgi:guanosine-3',5'-bis(diphosphate) 3'-pyrophosphohydrolase|nr:bifunctional (p)ppGpp synthetase/guanosine-3',5'-bis(diphosphate) 3'-pyrophosphohydrolase [Bacillota bacterium]
MLKEFLDKAKEAYREEDYALIEQAYHFAAVAHKDQKRISGESYIVHPVRVAETLINLGLDKDTVIAALLHDVLEDTPTEEKELKERFGQNVLDMVLAVTKLNRFKFNSQEEEQAENIRRLFLAMAKDIRVLLIKFADRLHNMRTLKHLPKEKQIKKAKETQDIYAPLAGRLGISGLKTELEDLAMKYLYPDDYHYLVKQIDIKREERMELVNKVASIIEDRLKQSGIKGEVKGRPKHFYSIYKKMKKQGKTFDQIYDLIAVRVIVETIKDCYTILGDIHSIWKPIPRRFKDYIAMPKPNMYQSLHTTVMTNFGQIFEIQIRTYEMNRIAEYGIAAHWKYKEGKTKYEKEFDDKLGFIKQLLDVQGDLKDSLEFIDTLKLNVSLNDIYVFSPKGDVFNLPAGSTCVDFAYRLHSAIGDKCVGAKINSKIVPLNTKLSNGDMIEILTNKNSKGPSRDWLKFVKTPNARAKIRSFFKKAMKEENIKTGKDMLEREAKNRGYTLSDLMHSNWVNIVLQRYSFSELDDMYASIGYGGISANQILSKLIEFYRQKQKQQKPPVVFEKEERQDERPKTSHSDILIEGFDDFLVRLSHCCNPVPGDEIVGYISRGRGVSVHRADCVNMKNIDKERLIKASWANISDNTFRTILRIECVDRNGILGQISATISSMKIPITYMNARTIKSGHSAVINIGVEIKDLNDIEYIIKKLMTIDGVQKVTRSN